MKLFVYRLSGMRNDMQRSVTSMQLRVGGMVFHCVLRYDVVQGKGGHTDATKFHNRSSRCGVASPYYVTRR